MHHLLFVHPDHKLIGIYQKHLGQHFSIDSASDGLAGLRKIKTYKPKMIISEYQLPFMSGLALLQFVRNHPEMYATPFLFLTNDSMPTEALGMGANAWLKQSEHNPEQLLHHVFNNYKFAV
jgi:CheY-like chemotaxis protein